MIVDDAKPGDNCCGRPLKKQIQAVYQNCGISNEVYYLTKAVQKANLNKSLSSVIVNAISRIKCGTLKAITNQVKIEMSGKYFDMQEMRHICDLLVEEKVICSQTIKKQVILIFLF